MVTTWPGLVFFSNAGELLDIGHRGAVDRVDGITGLQLAHRRARVGDGRDGHRRRVFQVAQGGIFGAVLGFFEVGVVGLVDVVRATCRAG